MPEPIDNQELEEWAEQRKNLTTYDRVYEVLEQLGDYAQFLAPSYDQLPEVIERELVGHLESALALIRQADPYDELDEKWEAN